MRRKSSDRYPGNKGKDQEKKNTGQHKLAINLLVVFIFAGATVLLGIGAGMKNIVEAPVFGQGVWIDDVDVSGWTREQAEATLCQTVEQEAQDVEIKLTFNDKEKTFNAQELGIKSNIHEIIDQAFEAEKDPDKSLVQNYETALEQKAGKRYYSDIETDKQTLGNSVEEFIGKNSVQATDASTTFHKDTRRFTYTASKQGITADTASVIAELSERIQNKNFDALQVMGEIVYPKVSEEDLKENTVLIGSCETIATDNANRNTNIRLMCEAVNGLKLEPDQQLSINELVGQRTAEKGFKEAAAIADGKRLVNELGGGICQLSGTLYNAALRANMEIVERVHHSFPSEYLPIGLDATLNWDDKDLIIKNTSEYPIYISAELDGKIVRVNLYGQPLPDGTEIEIVNNILKETDPGDPDIIETDEIPAGTRQLIQKEHKGYDVEVYRNYYKDGKLEKKELISKDHFSAIKAEILQGTNKVIK